MKKFKIKKNDKVVVITGKDRGKTGTVMSVLREKDRVVVSGVNLQKKHQKANGKSTGGIIQQEASMHISNIALFSETENKPSKAGYKFDQEGNKVRFLKKTNEVVKS